MRRRLVVMRHAKSSWKEPFPSDHERPLKGRGRREALRVAQELSELGWIPERVISSDSARTRETWACMSDGLPEPLPPVEFTRVLYHAGLNDLKTQLCQVDSETATVLVLGHNPGWEEVVERLTGQGYVVMKTAFAALLSTAGAGSWSECLDREGDWTLEGIVDPKGLLGS